MMCMPSEQATQAVVHTVALTTEKEGARHMDRPAGNVGKEIIGKSYVGTPAIMTGHERERERCASPRYKTMHNLKTAISIAISKIASTTTA